MKRRRQPGGVGSCWLPVACPEISLNERQTILVPKFSNVKIHLQRSAFTAKKHIHQEKLSPKIWHPNTAFRKNNMSYFDHQGHLTDEGLSLCADALKLGRQDQLPEELRRHLEQCASCQEQTMALYALVADEDYSGLGPHPVLEPAGEPAPASTLKMWFRPLLLLLMAVLALFLYWQQQKNGQPSAAEENAPAFLPPASVDSIGAAVPLSPPQAKMQEESQKPENQPVQDIKASENQKSGIKNRTSEVQGDLLAVNFAPSEALDPLVGAVTRSGGLSVIRPDNGAELEIGQRVVFSWQTQAEQPLTLRLLNNREEEVFSLAAKGGSLESPVALAPGLYYWKLETEDDLIYVGKFFVGNQRQD